MHPQFQRLMKEATALTQAGDMTAAMQAIRRALGQELHAGTEAGLDDGVIDVEARVVDPVVDPVADRVVGLDLGRDAPARPAPARPCQEEQFLAGSHVNAAGRRDYKLFVPAGRAGQQPAGLLVMLHGCTQNPDDFAAGTQMNALARAHGLLVLYPAQTQQGNAQGCWNWFKHNHQTRERGEPAILAGMTREIAARYGVPSGRIFIAGLSAGGAMAAIMGAAYPELFAAVGVHSGLAAGAARDLPGALAAMKGAGAGQQGLIASTRPTIVFHGDADGTVHQRNGDQVVATSCQGAMTVEQQQRVGGGGRRCTRRIHRDASGRVQVEHWVIHGAGHAWSGGSPAGSYADAKGPDASAEMLRFFLEQGSKAA